MSVMLYLLIAPVCIAVFMFNHILNFTIFWYSSVVFQSRVPECFAEKCVHRNILWACLDCFVQSPLLYFMIACFRCSPLRFPSLKNERTRLNFCILRNKNKSN
uniref:Putative secreted protein n=1 Tax=Ixodes ricinus TaxID=34613 RepID=A0A6B0UAB3_IXORI